MIESLAVAETNLALRRMNIDIDHLGRQVQKEKRDRVTPRHEQAAIGFLQGVSQAAVADPAAVDEQILQAGVAAVARRVGDEAMQPHRSLFRLDLVKLVADVGAEKQGDTLV